VLIFGLFKASVSVSEYRVSNDRILNSLLEGMGEEVVMI
jgi:hypothetical protein